MDGWIYLSNKGSESSRREKQAMVVYSRESKISLPRGAFDSVAGVGRQKHSGFKGSVQYDPIVLFYMSTIQLHDVYF